jgi:hypothetical protein
MAIENAATYVPVGLGILRKAYANMYSEMAVPKKEGIAHRSIDKS